VTLFYVHDCSQQEITAFLGLPIATVNNRLHAARKRLKRRTLARHGQGHARSAPALRRLRLVVSIFAFIPPYAAPARGI